MKLAILNFEIAINTEWKLPDRIFIMNLIDIESFNFFVSINKSYSNSYKKYLISKKN